jgi:hypothetical protein
MQRRTVATWGVSALALFVMGCGGSGSKAELTAGAPPSTESATIEVHALTGTVATIASDVERSQPVAEGVAVFEGLADGTYAVRVTSESEPVPETNGVGIGTARQMVYGGTYQLQAGDYAVVTCDDSSCSGVLQR